MADEVVIGTGGVMGGVGGVDAKLQTGDGDMGGRTTGYELESCLPKPTAQSSAQAIAVLLL